MSVNKAIIIGRLGQDLKMSYSKAGVGVTNMSIATSESWKDKDGQRQEKTEWHRIVVIGKMAENCNQYLRKGSEVYVEGRLQTRQWEDKNGVKQYTTEILASNVQFLGNSPKPLDTAVQSIQDNKKLPEPSFDAFDDIPF